MRLEEKRFKEKRLSIVKYIFIIRLNLSCVVSQGAWQGWKSLETFEHGATRLYNYGTQVKPPRCIVQSGDAVESCTRTRIHVPCIHEYTYAPESNSLSVTVGPISRSLLFGSTCIHVHICVYLHCTAYASLVSCTIYMHAISNVKQIHVSNSDLHPSRLACIFLGSTKNSFNKINSFFFIVIINSFIK